MHFRVVSIELPHDGAIPGGGPHKKEVIPAGTEVYCIAYGTKLYWAAYLDWEQANKAMQGLDRTTKMRSRRRIELPTLVAWNFRDDIPLRIARMGKK